MQCLNPNPNANYRGIFDGLVKIVQIEGVFRPVRGMSVVAFGAGPAHALYFTCYEFIKTNFSGDSRPGDNPIVNGIHLPPPGKKIPSFVNLSFYHLICLLSIRNRRLFSHTAARRHNGTS
jgi:hypothetical protein